MDSLTITYARRNSTLIAGNTLISKEKTLFHILPQQNEKFLCVPKHTESLNIRSNKSCEFISIDPDKSLKMIESVTSLSVPDDFKFADIEVKLVQSRWIFMTICVLFIAVSYMQWIQFSIITNIMMDFYKISSQAVDWTSIIFMVTYIVLVMPISYFLDTKNSRQTAIFGCIGTAIGSWIKIFALDSSKFYILLLGQFVVAVSQIFILSVPQKLSSVWFSPDEAFTVSGLSAFGAQFGIALGFFITPLIAGNHQTLEDVHRGVENVCFFTAGISTIVAGIAFVAFKERPKYPPSTVQALLREAAVENKDCWKATSNSLKNKNLHLLLLSYGIHTGVLNAFSTLLNQIVLQYFPNSEQDAGNVGAIVILAGLFGSIIFGFIIDTMKIYKATAVWVSRFSVLGMIFFCFALESKSKILLYVSSVILGFFMTGYQTVGQELALEIEYYNTESPIAALLNISSYVFGIQFTILLSYVEMMFGDRLENMFFILFLVIGTVIIGKSKCETNRKNVHQEITNEAEKLAKLESNPDILIEAHN